MSTRSLVAGASLTVALLTSCAALPVASSKASPSTVTATPTAAPPASPETVIDNQQKLDTLAQAIKSAVVDDHITNFTNVIVAPLTNAIDLWTVGPTPVVLKSLIESTQSGIGVTYHTTATYSADAQREAAVKLMSDQTINQPSLAFGFKFTEVAESPVGDGLTVHYEATGNSPITSEYVRQYVASTVGVIAVLVLADGGGTPTARWDAHAPWAGGSGFNISNGDSCSLGVAVRRGTLVNFLTARHCDPSSNNRWTNEQGITLTYGSGSVTTKPGIDSYLITQIAGGGGASGLVFTGGYNSNTSQIVGSSTTAQDGDYICTSGANTGEHCNTKVFGETDYTVLGYSVHVKEGFNDQPYPVGQGDSGGPVYYVGPDSHVGIVGIISGQGNSEACQSTHLNNPQTRCGDPVYFVDITTILGAWSSTIYKG